jgi:hypothetical protein
VSYFHFNTCTSWNKGSLLDESTNDAKGVVERSLSFVKYKLIGASQEYRDSLTLVGAASNLYNLA